MTRKQLSGTNRRRVLQGTGAGLAAMMAGCLGGGGNGDGGDGGDGGGGDGGGGDGGGGDGNGGGGDPTELPAVFMLTDYNNEPWQAKWEDLSSTFTEETDIGTNIEFSGMSGQQENRLATLIQSGDPPDINTSTFDQVADVWSTDGLATTNGVVEAAESVNGELLSTPLTVDGDIWQVPHGYYVSNFHYRTDVYEELGLDPPRTFAEVLENARVIDESDLDIRGYGLAGKKVGKSQDEFQVYLSHMGVSGVGVRWKDPDARNEIEAHWPEEEITTLLQFFKDISEYSPDPTSLGWSSSISNWLGGQFAQQYHLNHWPAGIAAAADIPGIAYNTETQALPYWGEGGVSKGDSWLFEPTPDGHHIFAGGDNTPGARQWLEYCYGSSIDRSASMYQQEPTRFLPIYADVLQSDTFQGFSFWEGDNQQLLDELVKIQNVQFGEHYGQVPESDLSDPVALYVTRQWFHGEMVNRVITGTDSVQEAYQWGRDRLMTRLEEGRSRFR